MTRVDPLSLYIHIPFCTLKCSYCDFNSYAGIEGLMGPFVEALVAEIGLWGEALEQDSGFRTQDRGHGTRRIGHGVGAAGARIASPEGDFGVRQIPHREPGRADEVGSARDDKRRRVETVFFGGGTPSLLPIGEIERVMGAVRESFEVHAEAEVSLEANPGTVDLEYLRGLVGCGVNRISFGVQSFHDDELAALDRIHSAEEAKEAFRWARVAGFRRVNLDLMFGLPSFDSPSATLRAAQDERMKMERWQSTLEQAIDLGPEHLSLYALTVEEGTKLAHDIDRGLAVGPDDDLQAEMYEWSGERLARAGYRQYEISNWSLPGEECRHNLVYWRNGEWLGLGPGAHSQLTVASRELREGAAFRFADVYSPKQYIETVRSAECKVQSGDGDLRSLLGRMGQVAFVEEQTVEMAMSDTAILGLRLNEGLDVEGFRRRFGREVDEVFGEALSEVGELGLVERENGRVRLTERGRLLANEVFVRLLVG